MSRFNKQHLIFVGTHYDVLQKMRKRGRESCISRLQSLNEKLRDVITRCNALFKKKIDVVMSPHSISQKGFHEVGADQKSKKRRRKKKVRGFRVEW